VAARQAGQAARAKAAAVGCTHGHVSMAFRPSLDGGRASRLWRGVRIFLADRDGFGSPR